jgi:outer membrane protease
MAVLPAGIVHAQSLEDQYTVSSWVSQGTTLWSFYNNNTNYGNPTSELEYKNTSSHIIEFSVLHPLRSGYFVRGRIAGLEFGKINGGNLYDGDFYSASGAEAEGATKSGAHRYSYTESDVSDGQVFYIAGELGKQFSLRGATALRVFGGYQYWEESYTAEDYTVLECTDVAQCLYPGYSLSGVGPVITNDTYWYIFYLGGDGDVKLTEHVSLGATLKYSPYVRGENYDTHVLRNRPNIQNPTGDPSFVTLGHGRGIQAELNAHLYINTQVTLSLGYRYWRQEIHSGTTTFYDYDQKPSRDLPAVELYTVRDGWLLSLTVDL